MMSRHVAASGPIRSGGICHLPSKASKSCLHLPLSAPPGIVLSKPRIAAHQSFLCSDKVAGFLLSPPTVSNVGTRQKRLSSNLPHEGVRTGVEHRKKEAAHVGRVSCSLNPELEKLVNVRIPGQDGRPSVAAFVARPTKSSLGSLPVVIMIHEFFGLTEDIVGKAEALAEELGALVIAPDTYRGDWTQFIPKAIFLALSTPQERVNEDLDSVVAWAAQQVDADVTRLVLMGFCYGGGKAIRYSASRTNAAATVVFYGSPLTDVDAMSRLKGPVLLVYGDKDAQFSPSKVYAFRDALLAAGVEVQLSMFPGQGHAFFRNMAQVKSDGPQRRAWEELLSFLRRVLSD